MFRSKLLSDDRSLWRRVRRRSVVSQVALEWLEDRKLFTAYYANASATANGSGTAASPWNNLPAISNYVGFHSGDVVYLSGTFTNQTLLLPNHANGVTVTSANASNPALINETSTYNFSSAIQVTTYGVTISNLVMTGPGITSDNDSFYAILYDNSGTVQMNGVTVTNVTESGYVFAGLMVEGTTAGYSNISITNSNFSNNQVSGIVVQGDDSGHINTNLLISNCITSGNAGAAIWWNANNYNANENSANGGIEISSVDTATVTHCTAIGNCYNSEGACGLWAHDATNLNFEYDESADNKTTYSTFDGNGIDFDNNVTNSVMQYDYTHGNDGVGLYICAFSGTIADSNDTIRYCVSDDDGRNSDYGIMLYSVPAAAVINANVYNNTVLASAGKEEDLAVFGPGASNITANITNNIFYAAYGAATIACSTFEPSSANLKFEGNDYFTWGASTGSFRVLWGSDVDTSMTSWRTSSGQETIGKTAEGYTVDPLMNNETVSDLPIYNVSNLQLSMTSPLRGAALDLTASPFSNTAPYNDDAPFNLAGTQWNGIGTQDYFGLPISSGTVVNTGADQSSTLTLTGTSGGDTFALKEDASSAHTLDVNSTAYTGFLNVVINGSTGNETVSFNYANGALSNSSSGAGVTFNGGSGINSFTTLTGGSGSAGVMPVYFTPGSGSNSLNVSIGSVTIPAGSQTGIRTATFSTIKIAASAKVAVSVPSVQSNRTLVVVTGGITLAGSTNAWTGTLDLGGNDLDVKLGNLTTLTNQVAQGWNNNWQGSGGIISSAAARDTLHLTALGVIQNTTNGSASGTVLHATFDSAAAINSDVLIKFTYVGDSNFSGKVDGSDYSLIDNGYLTHATGWYNGDLNGDGIINGSDYTLIDNAFNMQGASLAAIIASEIDAGVARPVSQTPSTPTDGLDSWLQNLKKKKVSMPELDLFEH